MAVTLCGQNAKNLPMNAPKDVMRMRRAQHVMGAAGTKRSFATPCKHIHSRIATALVSIIPFDSVILMRRSERILPVATFCGPVFAPRKSFAGVLAWHFRAAQELCQNVGQALSRRARALPERWQATCAPRKGDSKDVSSLFRDGCGAGRFHRQAISRRA